MEREEKRKQLIAIHESLEKELLFCETSDHACLIGEAQEELQKKIEELNEEFDNPSIQSLNKISREKGVEEI